MESLLNFIKEYGATVLAAVGVIVSFICIVVKRRPKTIDDFVLALEETLDYVPEFIIVAERCLGGSVKRENVLISATNMMKAKLHRPLSADEILRVRDVVSPFIEEVLSTPKKKGGR